MRPIVLALAWSWTLVLLAGCSDSGSSDAGMDVQNEDAFADDGDASEDAGPDAGFDAGTDAGSDAGMDAGLDAGPDAGIDAGPDAGDDGGLPEGDDGSATDAGDADETIPEPVGYYALQGVDNPGQVSDAVVGNPKVEGLSVRFSWGSLEPQKENYSWNALDAELARVKSLGKKFMIRPMAGVHAPAWLYDEGCQSTTADGNVMPIPWDPVMLENWVRFVHALGARYAADPDITLFHLSGPTSNSAEMHLPDNLPDLYPDAVDLTYSAWVESIDAYVEAFPGKAIALNIANPYGSFDNLARRVSEYLIEAAGPRATLQNNSLHATSSLSFNMIQLLIEKGAEGVRVGFQMLCPSSNVDRFGGPFSEAIDIGEQVGARYYEYYQGDTQYIP